MRLIDADALDEKLQALAERYAKQGRIEVAQDYNFVATVITAAPTIEAEPVKHGRWALVEYQSSPFGVDREYQCSICGTATDDEDWRTHYCHNCGAKMDLEVSE